MDRVFRIIKVLVESRRLPWGITALTFVLLLLFGLSLPSGSTRFAQIGQIVFWLLAMVGLVLLYLMYNRISGLVAEREHLQTQLASAEARVGSAYQRLEAIFRVSQSFVEANQEDDVIVPVLQLLVGLTRATGVSFVPLDEHGQPQTVLSHGELPLPIMETWLEYLASPGVRERCSVCTYQDFPERPANCPLLIGPFAASFGMLCLPVRRGEREYGVVSLFLPDTDGVDSQSAVTLRALLDGMALGLEGVSLRKREISALRQIQVLRQRTDLSALLNGLLENVSLTLDADFSVMVVPQNSQHQTKIDLLTGDLPLHARPLIDGILQGVMTSADPVLLGDVSGDPETNPGLRPYWKSLIAVPLLSPECAVLGVLMVGNRKARSFHNRQLTLLQTIAGQVALIVQNASLMAELEYQSMIQERARLAREIHDGLAQTIGFLKLQAAQLRNTLGRGEIERARQDLELFYSTLSEAYQDARQAIDGLRISPDECGLSGWLEQTTNEFRELSGLSVELETPYLNTIVSQEVQAQLIRILQEALSNVRKHARARGVWVACCETDADLLLEVRDDGQGFSPEDVITASRHGLRGMRERAELIGADFQVISRPEEGTIVRLRLPLRNLEETM